MPTIYDPTICREHRPGDCRVADPADYDGLGDGFYIEEFSFSYGWSIPAWEERGFADLCGPFPTREAALEALRNS